MGRTTINGNLIDVFLLEMREIITSFRERHLSRYYDKFKYML